MFAINFLANQCRRSLQAAQNRAHRTESAKRTEPTDQEKISKIRRASIPSINSSLKREESGINVKVVDYDSCQKSSVKITSKLTACVYSPKKQKFSFSYEQFGAIVDYLFASFQQTAQAYRTKGAITSKQNLSFPIDKIEAILEPFEKKSIEKISALFQEKKEHKSDQRESGALIKFSENAASTRLGLTPQEQVECIRNVHTIVLQWLKENSTQVSGRNVWTASAASILDNTACFDPKMANFFHAKFGLKCQGLATFSPSDLTKFKITLEDQLPDPQKLGCVQFALLKAGELHAKNGIFRGNIDPSTNLCKTLASWGYTPIETPQDNDLVMYIDHAGEPQHLGRYIEKARKVESKLGLLQPYFHWHDIFDVPTHYGNRVLFWRRPQTT